MSLKESLNKAGIKIEKVTACVKSMDNSLVELQKMGIHIKPIEIDREKTKIKL